jgi:S1-C subfamily serine protease
MFLGAVISSVFLLDLDKSAEYAYYDYKADSIVEESKLNKSVAIIQTGNGHGSGFFIRSNILITNFHVVGIRDPWTDEYAGYKENIIVQTYDGVQHVGRVVSMDMNMDLAMISIDSHVGVPLSIDKNRSPIGTKVFILGNGGYEFFHTSSGTVDRMYPFNNSNWKNNQQLLKMYVIGGFSGSPVIDMNSGKVVGVVAGGARDPRMDLGIMISGPDVLAFIERTTQELIKKFKESSDKKSNRPAEDSNKKDSIKKDSKFTTKSLGHEIEPVKVILSMLVLPRAAIEPEMYEFIYKFCVNNKINITLSKEAIIFRGKSEHLKKISNYIFKGERL